MATAELPEWAQLNPARSEALLRGYFNTWAMYGLQLSDEAFFGDKMPTKRLRGTLRELDKLGEQPLADRKEKHPMAGEATPLENANKELTGINKEVRDVRRSDALTPDEKRQQLDDLIRQRNDHLKETVEAARRALKAKEQDP